MNQDIFFLVRQVLLHRRRLMILLFLAFVPASVLAVRSKPVPFTATIKMFVTPPSSSPLGGKLGMGGLGGGISVLERDTIISGQATLATSRLVYSKVRDKLATSNALAPAEEASFVRTYAETISRTLFGESYVTLRRSHIDWNYLSFKSRIVFEPVLESGSFSLSYSDIDPNRALNTANALAEALIEVNRDILREQSASSMQLLSDKIEETRGELGDSSKKIVDFVRLRSFPNSDRFLQLSYEAHVKAIERQVEFKTQVKSTEALVAELERIAQTVSTALEEAVIDGRGARVEVLLADLTRAEMAAAQFDGTGGKDAAAALDTQIKKIRHQLQESTTGMGADALLGAAALRELLTQIDVEGKRAKAQLASFRAAAASQAKRLEQTQNEIERFPELQAELAQMTADHAQLGQVLALVTEQYYRTMIERDFESGGIHVVEEAAIAPGNISSKKSVVLLSALGMTALMIVLLTATREGLKGTIFARTQVEAHVPSALPLAIPHLLKPEIDNLAETFSRNDAIVGYGDMIRRHLKKVKVELPVSTILVTGATPEIGKSVTALLTALCFHRKDFRVAILDADYRARRRNICDLATWTKDDAAVNGRAALAASVDRYEKGNQVRPFLARADFGREPDLASVDFESTIREYAQLLKSRFDLIVIDGPPIFFSDALILGDLADATIVCVRQRRSTVNELRESVATISMHRGDGSPLFVVINDSNGDTRSGMISAYRQKHYGSTRRAA